MLKSFVEKIASMAAPTTYEIGGENFSSHHLYRIEPKKDTPNVLELTSLGSVCKMVINEATDLLTCDQILIQVKDCRTVSVFTTLDGEMDRVPLYRCIADTPRIRLNEYVGHESAVIQLQSLFIPNDDTAYLLKLLSSVSKESKVTSSDNGVTQTVQARSGIALMENVQIKPHVTLQPFRTFLEVCQPDSQFLLRLDDDGNVGLFEADGGVWKLEAVRNIAAYFERELADLIASGKVVVLR